MAHITSLHIYRPDLIYVALLTARESGKWHPGRKGETLVNNELVFPIMVVVEYTQ